MGNSNTEYFNITKASAARRSRRPQLLLRPRVSLASPPPVPPAPKLQPAPRLHPAALPLRVVLLSMPRSDSESPSLAFSAWAHSRVTCYSGGGRGGLDLRSRTCTTMLIRTTAWLEGSGEEHLRLENGNGIMGCQCPMASFHMETRQPNITSQWKLAMGKIHGVFELSTARP